MAKPVLTGEILDMRGRNEGSRKYWFKPGVVNNPKGRPKGSISLKEFAREYLLALEPEEKLKFLDSLPSELVFRMAEGNPHSTTDETVTHVIPTPIMRLTSVDKPMIEGVEEVKVVDEWAMKE